MGRSTYCCSLTLNVLFHHGSAVFFAQSYPVLCFQAFVTCDVLINLQQSTGGCVSFLYKLAEPDEPF